MQILLACAKIMTDKVVCEVPTCTEPLFQKESNDIALFMSERSVEELTDMLNCKRNIAVENKLRFERFFDVQHRLPAILAYNGQAYKCLQSLTLSSSDLVYAQNHLWITSFLYGMLRPLDKISLYRMEGNIEYNGDTIFNFWKPRLTDLLIDSVKADDGILVNLASEEMKSLFDWKRVSAEVKVIEPEFMVQKNGKLKTIVVYAKSCRGAMTRFIIKNRLMQPAELQCFEYEGFHFAAEYGDEMHSYFVVD